MRHSLRHLMLLALLTSLLPIGPSAWASEDPCHGTMNAAYRDYYDADWEAKKSADWPGWDRLIDRLRRHDCEFVDVGVTKSASTESVTVGSTFAFTIRVENNGTGPAVVAFSDYLPPEVEFVSMEFDLGSATSHPICKYIGPPGDDVEPPVVFCQYSELDPGYFSMIVTVRAVAPGSVLNGVDVRLDDIFYPQLPDLDPRNNSSSVAVTITN